VVTIVDPLHPGAPGDVVVGGSEREPWRATRTHYELLALVVALAAAVVLPAKAVSARAEDRRQARAEADAVSWSAGPDQGGISLTNDTPGTLRLLDVTLLAPGYEPVTVDREVKALTSTQVLLPDTRTCERSLMRREEYGEARVRVRTEHGLEVTRTVELTDAWFSLQEAAQDRCGWLPPGRSLEVTASFVRQGADLLLRGTARNAGKATLRVYAPGLDTGTLSTELLRGDRLRVAPGASVPYTARVIGTGCEEAASLTTVEVAQATFFVEAEGDDTVSDSTTTLLTQLAPLRTWVATRCG
jgi:hypothetical protein